MHAQGALFVCAVVCVGASACILRCVSRVLFILITVQASARAVLVTLLLRVAKKERSSGATHHSLPSLTGRKQQGHTRDCNSGQPHVSEHCHSRKSSQVSTERGGLNDGLWMCLSLPSVVLI